MIDSLLTLVRGTTVLFWKVSATSETQAYVPPTCTCDKMQRISTTYQAHSSRDSYVLGLSSVACWD